MSRRHGVAHAFRPSTLPSTGGALAAFLPPSLPSASHEKRLSLQRNKSASSGSSRNGAFYGDCEMPHVIGELSVQLRRDGDETPRGGGGGGGVPSPNKLPEMAREIPRQTYGRFVFSVVLKSGGMKREIFNWFDYAKVMVVAMKSQLQTYTT